MNNYVLAFVALSAAHGLVTPVLAKSILTSGAAVTEDFSSFGADGFSPTPTTGQLDSTNWAVFGLSDGDLDFGGTGTSGDYTGNAGGPSTGNTSTGGVYDYNIGNGRGIALGIQPTATDFTPGSFIYRLKNETGVTLSSFDFSAELWTLNNAANSSTYDISWSLSQDSGYTSLGSTASAFDASTDPEWEQLLDIDAMNVTTGDLASGDFIYLKFASDDASSSGARDEFAIDNISVTGYATIINPIPSPATLGLGLIGLVGLAARRRRNGA